MTQEDNKAQREPLGDGVSVQVQIPPAPVIVPDNRPWWVRLWHWRPTTAQWIKIGVLYALVSSTATSWAVLGHSSDLGAIHAQNITIQGQNTAIRKTQVSNSNGAKTTASDKAAISAAFATALATINVNHISGTNGQIVICATLNGMTAALHLPGVPACDIPPAPTAGS